MSESKTHGGKRPGAGRKPLGNQARERLVATLPPATLAIIERRAELEGVSRSEALTRCLQEWQRLLELGIGAQPLLNAHDRAEARFGLGSAVEVINEYLRDEPSSDEPPIWLPDIPDEAKSGFGRWQEADYATLVAEISYRLDDHRRLPRNPERLEAFYQEAIERLSLPGHERKVNRDLFRRQMQSLLVTEKQMDGLNGRISSIVRALLENWEGFVDGRLSILMHLHNQGYRGGFCWDDLAGVLGWTKEGWLSTLRQIDIYCEDPNNPDNVAEYTSNELFEYHYDTLHAAIITLLERLGLLKGPCVSCKFTAWPVSFRGPGTSGRPPREFSYCPVCRATRERRDTAAKMGKRNQPRFRA